MSEFILSYSVPKAFDLPCSVISWVLWFSPILRLWDPAGTLNKLDCGNQWISCNLQCAHSPDSVAPDVSSGSRDEPLPLSKAVAVSCQAREARDRDTLRDGSGDGKQIEEGLGENQGAAVAGWMWETRVEAVISGDSKMHGRAARQIGGFIKMGNRKEEE